MVQGHDHPWLLSHGLARAGRSTGSPATRPPWAAAPPRPRYRQRDAACSVLAADGATGLRFAEAQWAVTPGQSAVLYDGEVCLGGGVIAVVED